MRPFLALLLAALLLVSPALSAAQIDTDGPPAEDWYRRPLMRLTAFAAGQSDCLLLECGGKAMMIDGGSEPYRKELLQALKSRGISRLQCMLNTHYHDDHINGLYWLLRYGFPVDEYLHPYGDFAERVNQLQARTLTQARHEGVPIRQVFNGEELFLGEAVITLYRHGESETVNGKSMIQHIRFGDATMLLCSDIIGLTQSYFADVLPPEVLRADVMKAPHHGITPLSKTFLEKTMPKVMLFTNNEEGARRSILQAQGNGMEVFCAYSRTVVMETDGDDWYIYQIEGFQ